MNENVSVETQPEQELKLVDTTDSTIKFSVAGREMLKITPEGFFVEGRKAADDTEIYEHFKEFVRIGLRK